MILVTGANGTNGIELIRCLSRARASVRAMIRREPNPEIAAIPGIGFVQADFDDRASLHRALQGIDQAFLVTNSSERVEARQLAFVDAARTAGLHHLVYLSQLNAAANSPVRFLRYHAIVENAIASSGISFTHLRPNLYMQGLLGFRTSISSQGRFFAPAGNARVSAVDVRDIGAIAAAALTEEGHAGRIYDITGPEALTHSEMAAQLSRALGKHVAFVDTPDAVMREMLVGFGMSPWQADGLIEDYQHYRRGEASAVSSAVQDVTGRLPRTFAAFADDYRHAFLRSDAFART